MRAKDVSICKVQYLIDNKDKSINALSKKTKIYPKKIRSIYQELGIDINELIITQIGKEVNYNIVSTAELLEERGYGDMRMPKVVEVCRKYAN